MTKSWLHLVIVSSCHRVIMPTPTYCPHCGAGLERRFAEGREREICPACGFVYSRNPVPAVGVVVELDGRVVLIRRRYEPRAGYWALPAGFMELGESAEEAAIRECHEETGLLVQIDHLLGVYSFGFGEQSGLVIIYAATAASGTLAAGDDATEAGTFSLDRLPEAFAFRTHRQALDRWRRERRPAASTLLPPAVEGISIRYATHADAPAALELLLGGSYEDNERWLLADALFQDRLHAPDHPTLVVESDGAIVGVAVLALQQTLRGWQATLDELVVAPAHRRRGLGAALVQAASHLARLRGCTTLHVIAAYDNRTRDFFIACGFATGAALTLDLTPGSDV
jgi:ADP-ribose pyrophosphatase YjhB (NUDIX family)/N-acetylglutamate synthase-like GNAT family acetyltransferase